MRKSMYTTVDLNLGPTIEESMEATISTCTKPRSQSFFYKNSSFFTIISYPKTFLPKMKRLPKPRISKNLAQLDMVRR